MKLTTDSPWLSTAALASELDVPESTVRAWRFNGTGPRGIRVGKGVRYARADVEAWLDRLAAAEAASRPDADWTRTADASATRSRPRSG